MSAICIGDLVLVAASERTPEFTGRVGYISPDREAFAVLEESASPLRLLITDIPRKRIQIITRKEVANHGPDKSARTNARGATNTQQSSECRAGDNHTRASPAHPDRDLAAELEELERP